MKSFMVLQTQHPFLLEPPERQILVDTPVQLLILLLRVVVEFAFFSILTFSCRCC
jgi:hypothetical protein